MSVATLEAVYRACRDIDQWLERIRGEGLDEAAAGSTRHAMNFAAYYVLLFARFEKDVRQEYEATIEPVGDSKFMHLVNRLKPPHVRAEILDYYEVRCEIAHGRSLGPLPFGMDEVLAKLKSWSDLSDLKFKF